MGRAACRTTNHCSLDRTHQQCPARRGRVACRCVVAVALATSVRGCIASMRTESTQQHSTWSIKELRFLPMRAGRICCCTRTYLRQLRATSRSKSKHGTYKRIRMRISPVDSCHGPWAVTHGLLCTVRDSVTGQLRRGSVRSREGKFGHPPWLSRITSFDAFHRVPSK